MARRGECNEFLCIPETVVLFLSFNTLFTEPHIAVEPSVVTDLRFELSKHFIKN